MTTGLTAASTQAAGPKAAATPHSVTSVKVPQKKSGPGKYIVVLGGLPETAYDGRVAGFAATRALPGRQFDANRTVVRRYRGYLRAQQNAVLDRIGNPQIYYRFTTALNGFAGQLTAAQVGALRRMPGVLSVQPDKLIHTDTVETPAFLGLSGPHGVWAQHGGPKKAGDNLVVGVIDSGIWPENPSFAGHRPVGPVPGFLGRCETGERWTKKDCNSKVVSARYFVKGFGAGNIEKFEYLSPRDANGHGSHTASTAAGNHGVKVTIEGQSFGRASGMAPGARIAVYKALWSQPDGTASGAISDLAAAINSAVRERGRRDQLLRRWRRAGLDHGGG